MIPRGATIQNALRFALGIFSGKIILNFGVQKRLRAFLNPFLTSGAAKENSSIHRKHPPTVAAFSCEKGTPERPQTLRCPKVINLISAEDGQSARGGHFKSSLKA